MDVLVIGGSGPTGALVVERLLARGDEVRVLSRNPGRRSWEKPVSWVRGDLRDVESLRPAVEGVGAILMTSGTRNVLGVGSNTGKQVDEEGVRHVLDAAAAVGFQGRFGYLSTALALRGNRHPFGVMLNVLRGGVLTHKRRAEEQIRGSHLDYAILRPGMLTNGPSGRRLRFGTGDRLTGAVSRASVAEVMVQWLDQPEVRIAFDLVEAPARGSRDWTTLFSSVSS